MLSVKNGGDPIPPNVLPKIFQPYWRPAESKGHSGLGLGLHICSLIVKSHGGSLQVTSTVDHGTAFDIAGTGIAREASLVLSCQRAAQLAPGWDHVWQTARASELAG